ncbi:MAG: tRNA (5-methylaminomethyl-2-thiouridine)(34)-methyltransferase MnmD [Planctomycetota bacterium]
MGRRLELAEVSWRDGRLWSEKFGDVYASMGMAEARHVMLAGAGLPGRWKDRERGWPDGVFTIGELGFGAGLNFLAAWEAWDRVAEHRVPGVLRYVSVEGYPLERGDLERALAGLDAGDGMAARAAALVEAWPVGEGSVEAGTSWSVAFGGGVELVVLWGDVEGVLRGWSVPERGGIDAWFLDGFSPQRNAAMWSQAVLDAVGERSRKGARVATYTVAGAVRRELDRAGFDVRKRAGLGKKRDVLTGVLRETPRAESASVPGGRREPIDRVLVIGAGIAGCGVVKALVEAGVEAERVSVWDPGGVASGASGNAAGIVQPKLGSPQRSAAVAWYREAHTAMGAWLQTQDASVGWRAGALHLEVNERQAERLAWAAEEELGRWIGLEEASERLGVSMERGGLWVDDAWVVRPRAVCERWLAEAGVGVEARAVDSLEQSLEIVGADGVVVLANGDGVLGDKAMVGGVVGRVGGQVSGWRVEDTRWLRGVLCYGGYALPALDGVGWLGATYDHSDRVGVLDRDDEENRARLRASCGEVEALLPGTEGRADVRRAGLRVTTRDRLPVAGWLGESVGGGRVYASLGHGSRGLTGGLLSGRRVAAAMGLDAGAMG